MSASGAARPRSAGLAPLVLAALLGAGAVGGLWIGRGLVHRVVNRLRLRQRPPRGEPALPAVVVDARPPLAGHPRILLDRAAIDRIQKAAKRGTPAWRRLRDSCDRALGETLRAGYHKAEWGLAVADLTLCWHGTGERRFVDGAVRYLAALVDDHHIVGDGQGSDAEVRADDGYGIRQEGVYAALGYDWLHDAPGVTASLRARVAARLSGWLRWYHDHGYRRDQPISNYFFGYLTCATFAGLALSGEVPDGAHWLDLAREDLLGRKALPALTTRLRGGDWPEGWQYGELVLAEASLVAAALRTGTGVALAAKLPWLGETVAYHMHALSPDGRAVYDSGTWDEHPARPSAIGLTALPLALEGVDDARAAEARWLTSHVLPPFPRDRAWLAMLAERPGAPERDPHQGAPASYHAPGTGMAFFRSDFGPGAVWVSLQVRPHFETDHQHADAGHFELWRGSDWLIVDGGEEASDATINHNSLLVDDGGYALNYAPNQGTWGRNLGTTRFADEGRAALAAGDFTEAYHPMCVEDGCAKRSVRRAQRTLLYVRPALVVIEDRVALEQPGFGVAFAAHVTAAPSIAGPLASARVGASRVDLRSIEPAGAEIAARKEPTPTGEGLFRENRPWGPMWRLEIATPRGAGERRLLTAITTGPAGAPPPALGAVRGNGLRGLSGTVAGQRTAVLFADEEAGGAAELPGGADLVVVAGLRPGGRYAAEVAGSPGCRISVRLAAGNGAAGAVLLANAGGFVRLDAGRCAK